MANPNPDEQKVPDNPPPRWFPVMEMNTSDACLKGLTSRLDAYRGQTEWKIEGSTVVREFSEKLFMERTYRRHPWLVLLRTVIRFIGAPLVTSARRLSRAPHRDPLVGLPGPLLVTANAGAVEKVPRASVELSTEEDGYECSIV